MAISVKSLHLKALALPVLGMAAVVLASNILVMYPVEYYNLQDYLTFGAFTYPFAFFITDLTNRRFGPKDARKVIYIGFILAVFLSIALSTPRIALASGTAFLAAQLLDVLIFDKLRASSWWRAPLISSILSSALDTAIFFSLAFAGEDLPWESWAIVDYLVKLGMAVLFVAPYGFLRAYIPLRLRACSEKV